MGKYLLTMLFLVQVGHAQTKQIDSLLKLTRSLEGKELHKRTNDLAEILLAHNPTKSLELLENTTKRIPSDTNPYQLARTFLLKGKALALKADYEASLGPFNSAITLFGQKSYNVDLAHVLMEKGSALGYMGRFDEAQTALDESGELLKPLDDAEGLANCTHVKGHLMYLKGEDQKALELYGESLELHRKLENTKGISDNYFRMALAHLGLGDRELALDLLVKSKDLKEHIQDRIGLSKVDISLGVLHEENGNPLKAVSYYQQSLDANKSIGDKRVNAIIFNNLGVTYTDLKQYDSALVYHQKALDIRKVLGKPQGIVQSFMNIGEVYQHQQRMVLALQNYREAYQQSNTADHKPMLPEVADRLGQVFIHQGQLDSADHYLQQALNVKRAKGNYFSLDDTYNYLSLLEERRGNFEQALAYHKLFKKVRDSSFQVNANRELAEVQAKYDTERQQRQIQTLENENDKKTLWRNIFAVITLAALACALLLFQFFMYRNKKNKELLAVKESQHEELEKLDKLKSRFFSNISHEFRTPLTLILGPLDKIRKNAKASLQSDVDMIERNGNRLLKLINQLLDLSKIESGKVPLKAALVDIVPIVKGVVMSFESVANSKKIKLSVDAKQASHLVYVDTQKLEEILINLISNAFKYTPDGGKIKVLLEEDKQANRVKISVTDSGAGIPEQELEHIFNRFYQASNADTEDATGTGIGLSLVKELVELHKGEVKVQSKLGKGTTFEIGLPLGKSHLTEDQIVTITQSSEAPKVQKPTQNTTKHDKELTDGDGKDRPVVLMIEDNADLRTYIRGILEPHYQILEAVNGKEGLSLANEHIPDLVLSDLMMPKMDGLEVCKRLKEEMLTNHIPVILLTAKSSKEDKIEGLRNLADDYLTKPFNTQELLVRLQNLMAIRETLRLKFEASDVLKPKKLQLSSLDAIFMEKVTEQMETEIGNSLFGVVELAYAVGLSRSQLFRKMKAITNLTPNEYIRSFRLHRAMDMLKQQTGSVSEIAYATGFQNPSYFSKVFQEKFGKSASSVSKE